MLESVNETNEFFGFRDIMLEHFQKNKDKIRERIAQASAVQALEYNINIYKMSLTTNYKRLLEKFNID
jgi:hypothetical protein